MVDYREILRLKNLKYTNTDISSSVHSSRNTVQEVLSIADGINKYSVPFDLIGEYVDIRCTGNTVEVFFHGSRVASHARKNVAQKDPICIREHMPPEHQKYLTYNPKGFEDWAMSIGEYTEKVIRYFLYSEKEPEQGYKYCVSMMKMADRYGQNRLEKACERLLSFTTQPSLRSITTILKNGQDKLPLEGPVTEHPSEKRSSGITRGASAYRNGGDATC